MRRTTSELSARPSIALDSAGGESLELAHALGLAPAAAAPASPAASGSGGRFAPRGVISADLSAAAHAHAQGSSSSSAARSLDGRRPIAPMAAHGTHAAAAPATRRVSDERPSAR